MRFVWRIAHVLAALFNASFLGWLLFRVFRDGGYNFTATPAHQMPPSETLIFVALFATLTASTLRAMFRDIQAEANAHLIAAAPELYEALSNLLTKERRRYDDNLTADSFYQAEFAAEMAALAKARGEAS